MKGFSRSEYHMFYVLYSFVTYLLTDSASYSATSVFLSVIFQKPHLEDIDYVTDTMTHSLFLYPMEYSIETHRQKLFGSCLGDACQNFRLTEPKVITDLCKAQEIVTCQRRERGCCKLIRIMKGRL
jgi:hypothetical protein